jgi:hypothetical protein
MVKVYPLGLLLFEWLLERYQLERVIKKRTPIIRATTDLGSWNNDNPLYLYEGFVTGLFKPKESDYEGIVVKDKKKIGLYNNEIVDAYIMASALRAFVKRDMQAPIIFPESEHKQKWETHLRVCVENDSNNKEYIMPVKSYQTVPNSDPASTEPVEYKKTLSRGLLPPARVMSVWRHVISEVNDNRKELNANKQGKLVRIELSGKKACDVYGFKFRENTAGRGTETELCQNSE